MYARIFLSPQSLIADVRLLSAFCGDFERNQDFATATHRLGGPF